MKRAPLTVTAFGRTVTLRGDIDSLDRYGSRKDAIGSVDAIEIKVARSSTGGYIARISAKEIPVWTWSRNKILVKAVAAAERRFVARLVEVESVARAARKIVGKR